MSLLQTSAIDIVGFMAAASTVAAFSCSRMVPLRVAAIAANLLFISYGSALGLTPIWLLHAILLPLNILRLQRCLNELRQAPSQRPAGARRRLIRAEAGLKERDA